MRGEVLFEKMTGISDAYIAEAALVAPVGAEPVKKKGFASLPTAWRRGLTAACICVVAVLISVGGMMAWEPVQDFIGIGNNPSGQYTFYYQTDSPDSKHCVAMPGDTVSVDTGLQNEGKAFEASNFFARAYFVLQSDPSVVLEGEPYPLNEDAHAAVRTIKRGYRENMPFTFIIPEDAVFGVYDLVLSYGEEQQVYKGVLTVGEVETEGETYPPAEEGHHFTFGYNKGNNFTSVLGSSYPRPLEVYVINRGAPFSYEGDPDDFKPWSATLYHMESDYTIECEITESGRPPKLCHVESGQKGRGTYYYTVPTDAPKGIYGLKLTYRDASESIPNVIIVLNEVFTDYEDRFTFGYQKPDDAHPGDTVTIRTHVINNWDAFTFEGSSTDFSPHAVLVHRINRYTLEGTFPKTDNYTTITLDRYDTGNATQTFIIPTDAPTGDYDLVLSYGGYSQTFEWVLTVAEPTVEAPAILSNLTMPVGSEWLYEPIDEAYVPGELVTVRIKFATDVGTLFFLNGEVIQATAGDEQLGYWEYSFYMPDRDSEIIFQTYDGMAPYSDILEAYYTANPKAEGVQVSDYGTFGDGVRVAIIDDARLMYTQAEEAHRIGPAIIRYADGNFMKALHNGQFYSLAEAYETGLLSDADMAALENRQREWYPHLYADDE